MTLICIPAVEACSYYMLSAMFTTFAKKSVQVLWPFKIDEIFFFYWS